MEKEPAFQSIEDKFRQQIGERFDLWVSIIDEAKVSEGTKEKIKEILSTFRDKALANWWADIDDAFYGTINAMFNAIYDESNKNEAKALFQNIRDDMWMLFREIRD
ncbi:MAG: hypothetical protein A3B89_02190 [Candidatus Buchananbacteria bacterium RIFCSPHIGHO2_02_FULL_40_13]|uniref:Uncharacterized protein n=1 Tax=Candidatus Buchananbacteria bacterium RIFCSPLOWO2_01_FULL_39_33 TaxID=1797543 RepID=A0A1G1YL52_9BACT|nr:MAG: hypothetical protein A2820_02820 [Candidatus Buchananbacteria bacterium RIFCSPHIGHO2_01_FULL_40_35]OGY50591.1 MAG: hypothetical protein A3B89_02190 [Candidatus Buchananbacteria bacterium RIFCSPHIGHO2_02_FULL_40_13]OGY53062.1 MAG: hypothetical protein A3A02_03070 [Candidatus Buchananbacteria bacterium RIFCSPLOWO2_01_FULL_39_33]